MPDRGNFPGNLYLLYKRDIGIYRTRVQSTPTRAHENDHLFTHLLVIYIGVHIGGTERGKNALTGTHRG